MTRAPSSPPSHRLQPIRLLAMDVDGVLTNGGITWSVLESEADQLIESKTFSARDGLGIGLVRSVDIEVAWITGRHSRIVERRARELGVAHLVQGCRNKRAALEKLQQAIGLEREQVLYIGDDLNDLPAFDVAGVSVAVAEAAVVCRDRADWVTERRGGEGAVREVVDAVLTAQSRLDEAHRRFLAALEQRQ